MATHIRITPIHGGDSCPHCPPYVNYNNAIQKFDNKVISRVQSRPTTNMTSKGTLNYAILRLHQEAVWMKLGLYHCNPSPKIKKPNQSNNLYTTNILIDTGAALSLIKENIINIWRESHPENIYLQETSQKAETCSGSQLQITHKCKLYNCNLSGGPPLTLEFFVCKNLFCDAILGLPEMRTRQSSIDLRSFVFKYALTRADPGYKNKKTDGKGMTTPIIPRLQKPISIAPLGQVVIPCIGHWGISLKPEQLGIEGYNLIPIQTLTKGRACYVKVLNTKKTQIEIQPKRISFTILPPSKRQPKSALKKSKNWLNATLEEYSDFIFAHGRYNNLATLDSRIKDSLMTPDPIKDDHSPELSSHPFGKGTHSGNLLIGILLEIYRSTYHYGTSLDSLLDRAAHLPTIMKDASTTQRTGQAKWFQPTLKEIEELYQAKKIQQLYVKIPRRLCYLGINLISRLSMAESHTDSES